MYSTFRRFKPAAQLVGVLACTYAVFHLAIYVWLNSPNVARQRMDRSNEQIVERVQAIYAANDWPGMETASAATGPANEELDVALATVPPCTDVPGDCFCPDDTP